jgi:hypothetical protein
LIGSALNLQINLGRIDIFTLLSLPIQEHGMPLHFFRCFFMSFSNVLQFFFFFFSCRSHTLSLLDLLQGIFLSFCEFFCFVFYFLMDM